MKLVTFRGAGLARGKGFPTVLISMCVLLRLLKPRDKFVLPREEGTPSSYSHLQVRRSGGIDRSRPNFGRQMDGEQAMYGKVEKREISCPGGDEFFFPLLFGAKPDCLPD